MVTKLKYLLYYRSSLKLQKNIYYYYRSYLLLLWLHLKSVEFSNYIYLIITSSQNPISCSNLKQKNKLCKSNYGNKTNTRKKIFIIIITHIYYYYGSTLNVHKFSNYIALIINSSWNPINYSNLKQKKSLQIKLWKYNKYNKCLENKWNISRQRWKGIEVEIVSIVKLEIIAFKSPELQKCHEKVSIAKLDIIPFKSLELQTRHEKLALVVDTVLMLNTDLTKHM